MTDENTLDDDEPTEPTGAEVEEGVATEETDDDDSAEEAVPA
jgi:hypothetical protein